MARIVNKAAARAQKKPVQSKAEVKIPEGVIERLSTYLESLIQLDSQGITTISSKKLGEVTRVHPAEIRRDFTFFGTFGKKGVGYSVRNLIVRLQKILGADEPHKLALVGAGNLGTAIASYDGLSRHGFFIAAVFDNDKKKIGKKIGKVEINSVADLEKVLRERDIRIGILAVPPRFAQSTADQLVAAGIRIIINYTSALVDVPENVKLHNTEPVKELLHTLYYFSSRGISL